MKCLVRYSRKYDTSELIIRSSCLFELDILCFQLSEERTYLPFTQDCFLIQPTSVLSLEIIYTRLLAFYCNYCIFVIVLMRMNYRRE